MNRIADAIRRLSDEIDEDIEMIADYGDAYLRTGFILTVVDEEDFFLIALGDKDAGMVRVEIVEKEAKEAPEEEK